MEDSTLFMQWAMDTLQNQQPASVVDDCGETTFPSLQALRHASHEAVLVPELMAEAHAANSWSTGDTTDGGGGGNFSAPAAMEHDVWPPSPNSSRCAPRSSSSGTNLPVTSWNFSAASTQPVTDGMLEATAAAPRPYNSGVPELVYGSAPTRRSSVRSTGPMSSAPHAQDHIIAERNRREKINRRFIELSTVIPGLKKMDKATILSDAASYVKELQEKLKALEAAGSNGRSIGIETVVLVKKPSLPESVTFSSAPNTLPEIEARFSENSLMMRIHCENGKGVVVKVLAEVEELHLCIIHTNVVPFPVSTVIITIMAKVEEGFTVTAEEIVGRLSSALLQHSSCKNTTEETGN